MTAGLHRRAALTTPPGASIMLRDNELSTQSNEEMMIHRTIGALLLVALLGGLLGGCGGNTGTTGSGLLGQDGALYVTDLLAKAQDYNGKSVTVEGAYIGRAGNPATSVLALGVSTLDNGLDAQPLG